MIDFFLFLCPFFSRIFASRIRFFPGYLSISSLLFVSSIREVSCKKHTLGFYSKTWLCHFEFPSTFFSANGKLTFNWVNSASALRFVFQYFTYILVFMTRKFLFVVSVSVFFSANIFTALTLEHICEICSNRAHYIMLHVMIVSWSIFIPYLLSWTKV